jgi:hypothetical protein
MEMNMHVIEAYRYINLFAVRSQQVEASRFPLQRRKSLKDFDDLLSYSVCLPTTSRLSLSITLDRPIRIVAPPHSLFCMSAPPS